MRSFTNGEVVFKPTHLSKQSRASKPVEDFFYPSFPQDTYLCPVETLKSYETRTLEFRRMDSDSSQTRLFLSWTHSVRGASCSTAAWAGVTTSDILKAADWSSEGTSRPSTTMERAPVPELPLEYQFWLLQPLQTYMLIWKQSLPKCNLRMAQGTQCLHVMQNYMRKVKLKYQHVHPTLPTYTVIV